MLVLVSATGGSRDFARDEWPAHWIALPGASPYDYGVYHFRRTFNLAAKPEHFVVYVSGDNRYELFANGKRVSWGPARGDLTHWRYEKMDIASQLAAGKNVLAATVWNDGPYRAVAQVTNETGFLLQAEDPSQSVVNTNREWLGTEDKSYAPQPLPPDQATGYYALAANEHVDARLYPWDWQTPGFDDSGWTAVHELTRGAPRDMQNAPNRWMLVAREIPLEEQRTERFAAVREAEGVMAGADFLSGRAPITVPAHTAAKVLLDRAELTTAYPELTVSKGAGSRLDVHYAETLYVSKDKWGGHVVKANRNVVEGKQFFGPFDTFLADGGEHRLYRPLYWRTYRYVELDVTTQEEPLVLENISSVFTAYPFERRGEFAVEEKHADRELQRILSVGWRTARLCAHETYMDCPFYEQLQYGGDARIQMLISLYMTGDARLMKNGISLLNSSRTSEGATYSRAPSYLQQYIPPFSLWWIGMVHDYWMFVEDPGFVKEMLPGVEAVLSYYARYQKENSSLEHMPWWNFIDWVKQWPSGEPAAEADGSSAAGLDLQLLLALRWAADLEKALGNRLLGETYQAAAARLQQTIVATDWDENAGLFADQPSHRTYSQQINTLAVLAHIVPDNQARSVVEKMLGWQPASGQRVPEFAQSSIYFRAYTNAALREVGLGDRYMDVLDPWRQMLAEGLTTWAEWNGADTRSDCHAWGASPNFELLRTVAGIDSAAPGFKAVRIAPNIGAFRNVNALMPHPSGTIRVNLKRGQTMAADIELPAGVNGQFVWSGTVADLHEGKNHLEMR